MTAVISDYVTGQASVPTMIATTTIQHQHSREASHYRASRSREAPEHRASASPRHPRPSHALSKRSDEYDPSTRDRDWERGRDPDREKDETGNKERVRDRTGEAVRLREEGQASGHDLLEGKSSGGASRFPSPPHSSSPNGHTTPAQAKTRAQVDGSTEYAPSSRETQEQKFSTKEAQPSQSRQQPSPASDDSPMADADAGGDQYHETGSFSPRQSPVGQVIQIRDLAHIQSLARADLLTGNGPGILNDQPLQQMKYDIHQMPINDIIEMVASLLQKITQTNDLQHDAIQRNVTHQQQANQNNESGSGSQMSPLSTSVLAFHGKNVPAITIHSYLSRIHRYCPTTYEVFLSLLVYFDRMTERVNDMVTKNEQAKQQAAASTGSAAQPSETGLSEAVHASDRMQEDHDDSESVETDSDLADDDEDEEMGGQGHEHRRRSSNYGETGRIITASGAPAVATGPATYFVVDSFNIHRLIIAGVTCASKFFSDVFYTNSRYAKVGGLPLPELNHLELQFLLLNDFQLFIPVEDLDAYATMLVEFYAREVVAQNSQSSGLD